MREGATREDAIQHPVSNEAMKLIAHQAMRKVTTLRPSSNEASPLLDLPIKS